MTNTTVPRQKRGTIAKTTGDATEDLADGTTKVEWYIRETDGKKVKRTYVMRRPVLPKGWTSHKDHHGDVYYHNVNTGESSWELPRDTTPPPPTSSGPPSPAPTAPSTIRSRSSSDFQYALDGDGNGNDKNEEDFQNALDNDDKNEEDESSHESPSVSDFQNEDVEKKKKKKKENPHHRKELLDNAKSLKEVLDACLGYTGLMAGFEGFIINEYASKYVDILVGGRYRYVDLDAPDDQPTVEVSLAFEVGLFLFAISFAMNITASILALVFGVYLRQGLYRTWFTTVVGRIVHLFGFVATATFSIAVMAFFWTTGIQTNLIYAFYFTCGGLISMVLILFFAGMYLQYKEPAKTMTIYMEKINGE